MDDMPSGEPSCGCDNRLACRKTVGIAGPSQLLTGGQNFRTTGTVNGSIHASATQQCSIRHVDDGINGLRGEIPSQHTDETIEKACFFLMQLSALHGLP